MEKIICDMCLVPTKFGEFCSLVDIPNRPEFNVCEMCVRVLRDELGSEPLKAVHLISLERAVRGVTDD